MLRLIVARASLEESEINVLPFERTQSLAVFLGFRLQQSKSNESMICFAVWRSQTLFFTCLRRRKKVSV